MMIKSLHIPLHVIFENLEILSEKSGAKQKENEKERESKMDKFEMRNQFKAFFFLLLITITFLSMKLQFFFSLPKIKKVNRNPKFQDVEEKKRYKKSSKFFI